MQPALHSRQTLNAKSLNFSDSQMARQILMMLTADKKQTALAEGGTRALGPCLFFANGKNRQQSTSTLFWWRGKLRKNMYTWPSQGKPNENINTLTRWVSFLKLQGGLLPLNSKINYYFEYKSQLKALTFEQICGLCFIFKILKPLSRKSNQPYLTLC